MPLSLNGGCTESSHRENHLFIFKKTAYLIIAGSISVMLFLFWSSRTTAQIGTIDDFTFLIPFKSDSLLIQFRAGNNLVAQADEVSLQTIISIPVNRAGTIIYYDQWEDGYETDLTLPTQTTTLVWGDGNLDNGIAPTIRDQGGGDSLNNDDVIVLENRVFLPGDVRDPATFYFDGGDALTAQGGSIAVTEVVWPLIGDTGLPGSLYTDAWELYPTGRWGNNYIIPIGEDLVAQRSGFRLVGINIQAAQDGTNVTVTGRNGTLKETGTLNFGQELTLIQGITVGDRITATKPVQVQLFTANPDVDYEQRGYTMVPLEEWGTDYLAPRSDDGDFWLYNPQTTPLTVTAETLTGSDAVPIPAGQTVRYSNTGAGLSTVTAARFTAPATFYGLVALDDNEDRDWGYSLQPVNRLTPQTLIGWAPANNQVPPTGQGNYSPVYVTAVTTTTVTVDYADTTPDLQVLVPPLAQVRITSPVEDMTGAFLYTTDGTPFLAVWGEESNAPATQPGIDAGGNIVPIFSLALQKRFEPRDTLDCSGMIRNGDDLRFNLDYFNNAAYGGPTNVTLIDDLPPEFEYVPGSTRLNGVPVPDGPGNQPPFSPAGGGVTTPVDEGASGGLTFRAVLTNAISFITNEAQAISPLLGQATARVTVPFELDVRPILQIDKNLISPTNSPATWGQTITFSVRITNTSNQLTINKLSLQDTFAETDLTFLQANPPPDLIAGGLLTWTNLISDGLLLPNETVDLTTAFRVNPGSTSLSKITNLATFNNVAIGGGESLIICSDATEVEIVGPTPTPTATSSSTATPTSTSSPTPSPTYSPTPTTPSTTTTPPSSATPTPPTTLTATPTATPVPSITITTTITTTPPLPINLLPETGAKEQTFWCVPFMLFIGLLIGFYSLSKG